jgi:NADPH-dependent curcumin reductase CurA
MNVATVNRAFRLASRPVGLPTRDNWDLTEEPVVEPEDGQVLV